MVTVLGRGFAPLERVGIVMCTSEADVEGVAACDLGVETESFRFVTYANADEEGSVVADVTLRQAITTPYTGAVDCMSAAERGLVAIGAVSDYDRSGGSYIGFAGAPPFAEPVLSVEPAGPYQEGQEVKITVAGLPGPRRVQLSQRRDDRCAILYRGDATHDGVLTATVALVGPVLIDQDEQEVPCESSCVVRLDGLGLPEATTAPLPWPASILYGDEMREPITTGVPDEASVSTPPPTPPPAVATTTATTLVPTTPVTTVSVSTSPTTSG